MSRSSVIAAIITALETSLASAVSEARAASSAATDPDSKAENKYDTRALEASYLARGLARRVTEISEALAAVRELADSAGTSADVRLGSSVVLETPGGHVRYFIAPAGGGMTLMTDGEVTLLTPASPLGRALSGLRAGDAVPGRAGWRIRSVD